MGLNTSNVDDEYFDDTLTIKELIELYKTRPSDKELEKKEKIIAQKISEFLKTNKTK